ncbi:MAG: hypothetical protein AAF558_10020 [Verrucomicrobiota bacterium]
MAFQNRVLIIPLLLLAFAPWRGYGLLDQNGDGMSDIWQSQNGNEATAGDPQGDLDGDGESNQSEAMAGTSASDPNSKLTLSIQPIAGDQFELRWDTLIGKRYQIQTSTTLDTWTDSGAPLAGDGGQILAHYPGNEARRFWRLIVSDVDSDGDRLDDWEEYQLETDASLIDSDGDQMSDYEEVTQGLNPTDSDENNNGIPDGMDDPDEDGLTTAQELSIGTIPNNPDSDADGVLDGNDGWALEGAFSPKRIVASEYLVIDTENIIDTTAVTRINKASQLLFQSSGLVTLWENGSSLSIGYPAGVQSMIASDLSDDGTIVGSIEFTNPPVVQEIAYPARYLSKPFKWERTSGYQEIEFIRQDLTTDEASERSGSTINVFASALTSHNGHIFGHVSMFSNETPDQYLLQTGVEYESQVSYGEIFEEFTNTSSGSSTIYQEGNPYLVHRISDEYYSVGGLYTQAFNQSSFAEIAIGQGLIQQQLIDQESEIIPSIPITSRSPAISSSGHINNGDRIWIHTGSGNYFEVTLNKGDLPPTFDNLNSRFQVVGGSYVWQNYSTYDLNSQILQSQNGIFEWQDVEAYDINDCGVIAASAKTSPNSSRYSVLLLPFNIESQDRAVHGTIVQPESWSDFRLQFTHLDTSQDLGTYNLSDTSEDGPFIYESIDDVASDSEIDSLLNNQGDRRRIDQDVVFVRDSEDPHLVHFYTVFDDPGEIEVKLIFGPNDTEASMRHTLEVDTEIGAILGTWDDRADSTDLPEVPNPPIDWDGDGYADPGPDQGLITASQPGTLETPGAFVTEVNEDNPLNLIALINDDDDNNDSTPDNSDLQIDSADDDLVRLDLQLPQGIPSNIGTITLAVSDSSKFRLFNTTGTAELVHTSVNLSAPTGDLADLATQGRLALWGEALAESNEVTITVTYDDGSGTVVSDSVHLTTASPQTASLIYMLDPMRLVAHNQIRLRIPDGTTGRMQWRNAQLATVGASDPIKNRNSLSKFTIWMFENPGVQFWGSYIIGYTEGFWDMANGEVEAIGELVLFLSDPAGRMKLMYDSIKELAGLSLDQYRSIAQTLYGDYLNSVEAALPWQYQWNGTLNQIAYSYGYLTGVATEVAVVFAATGGVGTLARGTLIGAKIGQTAGVVASGARRFTMAMLQRASQYLPDPRILREASRKLEIEEIDGKPIAQIIQERMEQLNPLQLNHDTVAKEIAEYAEGRWERVGYMAYRRLGEFIHLMGDNATEKAITGFLRTYGRLLPDGDLGDRFEDLASSFKAETLEGKQALKESLEAFKDSTDNQTGNIRFEVSNRISALYPTMYHYANDSTFRFMEVRNGKIFALTNPNGRYVTPNFLNSTAEAKSVLQLPDNGPHTARYRFKFSVQQVEDDFQIPYGFNIQDLPGGGFQYNLTPFLEPKTRQNPLKGAGGGIQFTESPEIEVDEIFDFQLGRNLTLQEVQTLIDQ